MILPARPPNRWVSPSALFRREAFPHAFKFTAARGFKRRGPGDAPAPGPRRRNADISLPFRTHQFANAHKYQGRVWRASIPIAAHSPRRRPIPV